MARKKKIIITVAVIAAVCGAVALGWHSLMSFDVTTDISDYIDTDEFEGTYGLRVFPDEARKEDVMEYYYAYRDIFFDPDVQLYLRCKYTPERYAEECERLSRISVSHEGQTHRIQYNTEDYTFPAYEAIHGYDCSYEYALLNVNTRSSTSISSLSGRRTSPLTATGCRMTILRASIPAERVCRI